MIEKPITDYDEEVRNCSCSYCGNNCDDITYLLKDKKIVGVRHACRIGASKIINDQDQRLLSPLIRNEEGILEETTWDIALDMTAQLLYKSDRPVFYGWGETSVEAIKKGIKIAEKTGDSLVGNMAAQGTTPRQYTDLLGSLCDLTSGSGDKGTPIVLVQGYFDNYTD